MAVDWNKPIEAYNAYGEVEGMVYEELTPRGNRVTTYSPGKGESNCYWEENGDDPCPESTWKIRNVATIATPNPATIERCVELVRRMSKFGAGMTANMPLYFTASDFDEARAIIAELEPVDPDKAEASKIIDDFHSKMIVPTVEQIAVAAIRRGRELERNVQ